MTDTSKDLIFEEPRVPNKYAREDNEDKTQPRGYWTIAEVEEVCWRVRASGGTDSTEVRPERGKRGGMSIRAVGVEVFSLPDPTMPPRMPPGDDPRAGHEIPSLLSTGPRWTLPKPVRYAVETLAVLTLLPVLLGAFLYAWAWLFEAVF